MSAAHRTDSMRRAAFGLIVSGYLALAVSDAMNLALAPLVLLFLAVAYRLRAGGAAAGSRWRKALRAGAFAGMVMTVPLAAIELSPFSLAAGWVTWGGLALVFAAESERNYYASFLVALAQLVVAGGSTDSVVFALAVLLFIVSGTLALATMTLRGMRGGLSARLGERGDDGPAVPVIQNGAWEAEVRTLGRLATWVTGVIVAATVVLFFVIPRYGAGYFFAKDQNIERRVAFSDTVDFGAVGAAHLSNEIALRVELLNVKGPYPGFLRWRGVGLGHFDGHRWSALSGPERVIVDQNRGFRENWLLVGAPLLVGSERIEQKIYLARQSGLLFGASRPFRVWGKFTRVARTVEDTLTVKFPAFSSVHYTCVSDVGRPRPEVLRAANGPYPTGVREGNTQLPDGLDPRVRELALKIVGSATNNFDRVARLEAWLKREMKYELPSGGKAPESPVEEFLFDRRKGHCEYFATALAVMARTLGVPARVVNGYAGGSWSRLGGYYVVVEGDAHSWVEVFFQGYGWLSFDATPESALDRGNRLFEGLGMYWDALVMAWRRYVVDYHLLDQIEYAKSIVSFFHPDPSESPVAGTPVKRTLPPVVAVVLLMTAALILLVRGLVHQARTGRGAPSPGDAAFYMKMLALVARRGIARAPAATPLEFANHVAREWPEAGEAVLAITLAYQRVRFGARPAETERALAEERLAALGSLPRRSGATGSPLLPT